MCLGLGRAQESQGIEGKAPIWGYRIPPPPSPPSAVLGMWLLWTHTALSAGLSPHLLAPATPSLSLRPWGPTHPAHAPPSTGSFPGHSSPDCRKHPAVCSLGWPGRRPQGTRWAEKREWSLGPRRGGADKAASLGKTPQGAPSCSPRRVIASHHVGSNVMNELLLRSPVF